MKILSRTLPMLLTLVTVVACGARPSAPPSSPDAAAEPESSGVQGASVDPVEPGELRCGLDDGPVPVGRLDEPDLRVRQATRFGFSPEPRVPSERGAMGIRLVAPKRPPPPVEAAPPTVGAQWSLDDGLAAPPSFVRRAEACTVAPSAADLGDHAFTVRFHPDGHALVVRAPESGGAGSSLRACFAAALCETVRAPTAAGLPQAQARLGVKTLPPVFIGTVDFTTGEDSRGARNRDGSPTGRNVPRRGPFTADEHRWHDGLGAMLEKGTLACARRTPPARALRFEVRLPYDQRARRFSAELAGKTAGNAFERELQRCFAAAAVEGLLPPPAGLVPNGAITLYVGITPDR